MSCGRKTLFDKPTKHQIQKHMSVLHIRSSSAYATSTRKAYCSQAKSRKTAITTGIKRQIKTLCLIAVLSSLSAVANADLVVWSQNFDDTNTIPLGPYGTTENFGTQPALDIIAPGMGGTGQAMEITFTPNTGQNVNFQTQTLQYPASGNTNAIRANYTLEFDMQIAPFTPGFIMEISVQGPGAGTFNGDVSRWTVGTPILPNGGAGYVHVSLPLSNSVAGNSGTPLNPTDATFRVAFGALAFPSTIGDGVTPETIDVDNIVILMNTNPPPVPPPVMNLVKARPALRIFEKNSAAVFNQEGIGTVDSNQSWLGSTPTNPTSYKIDIASFPSVANTVLHMQFVQVGFVNPFVVFSQPSAMEWRIRRTVSGFFDQRIAWKTNAPNNGGLPNISLPNTVSSSTTGIGTWTLTFTNDTDGYVTAPDGTSTAFILPPDMVALFANPVELCIGTTPGSAAGYGEFFDFNRITLTNAATGTLIDDDFTQDDVLNTSLWNPAFSLDAPGPGSPGSVFLVSTNAPFWVNWTVPDDLFVLATKAAIGNASIPWYTPNYYGSGVGATNSMPSLMGTTLKWTLIPSACLPTTDGTTNGPASTKAFFLLQKPGPSQ
jgi:hypothetical protein